jgi:DNA repair photolyase
MKSTIDHYETLGMEVGGPGDLDKNHHADTWSHPVLITRNNFVNKSLSSFACNVAVGCGHGCSFCYVPSVTANKLAPRLATYGVNDPDAQWGDYAFIRQWNEKKFIASLLKAERTPRCELNPDGNRAIIFCSTTDAYQVIRHPDKTRQKELNAELECLVRRCLELIRDHSTLNVRILTRSPLSRRDFDLYRSFGSRLLFGMSIPTLRNDLARIYEPRAPAPSARLATLTAAKAAGLNVFVAMAPTYPECNRDDLAASLLAFAKIEPLTIFHEPINVRADNARRIQVRADALGVKLQTEVFASAASWRHYAWQALFTVRDLARDLDLSDRLHLWPDKSLGSKTALQHDPSAAEKLEFLKLCWSRVSEWPNQPIPQGASVRA